MSKRNDETYVMLAADAQDEDFRFPVIASPKIDGFRFHVKSGKLLTRSNKSIDNLVTSAFFSHSALEGLDGEMVVGNPAAPDVFHVTSSGLRTRAFDPQATYLVFDVTDRDAMPFDQRMKEAARRVAAIPSQFKGRVISVTQVVCSNIAELNRFEDACIDAGFEGVIVRSPRCGYKHGRSTVEEQGMMKLKRFVDAEAVIVGVEEEIDKSGRAKGSLGALIVRDLKTGVQFNVGTGFTAKQRADLWRNKPIGQFVKYKFFPRGTKDRPRHPGYLGLRSTKDMDDLAVQRGKRLLAKRKE